MARGKAGRPTEYRKDMPERAYELMRDCGLTEKRLATAFGVHVDTIAEWKRVYPEFAKAIREGRRDHDSREIETSLARSAKGYNYNEVKHEYECDTQAGTARLKATTRIRKHVPANVAAASFWLKNRAPKEWRDKQEVEMRVAVTHEEALRELEDDSK